MNIKSKKLSMADKMYDQNSKGGVGTSPKFKQVSSGKGTVKQPIMNSKGGVGSASKFNQSNKSGSITGKYNQ